MTEIERLQFWLKHRTKGISLKNIIEFKKSDYYRLTRFGFLKSKWEKAHVLDFMEYVDFVLKGN